MSNGQVEVADGSQPRTAQDLGHVVSEDAIADLTKRFQEVLRLLAAGQANGHNSRPEQMFEE